MADRGIDRIFGFLSPATQARILQQEKDYEAERYRKNRRGAVAWDEDKTAFAPELVVRAETYTPFRLFDVPATPADSYHVPADLRADCPGSPFYFCRRVFPGATALKTASGRRRGKVWFTGPVEIPIVAEARPFGQPTTWMSYTPMEVFTIRPGIRLATGTVLVGGLGMGWMLVKVCRKPSVERVIVVEKSRALLDWVGPRLRELYPETAKMTDWVCGDVYEHVNRHGSETRHLLDIWDSGGGDCRYEKLLASGTVKHLWGWGVNQ